MRILFSFCGFLFALMSVAPTLAEDGDPWAQELDFGFSTKGKSTIADFPMQEISSEELSNAAIGGALQSAPTMQREKGAKPAFQIVSENEGKQLNTDTALANDNQGRTDDERIRESSIILPQPIDYQQPIFSHDNGRTVEHNNTAFER
jgi:hypothetical protein